MGRAAARRAHTLLVGGSLVVENSLAAAATSAACSSGVQRWRRLEADDADGGVDARRLRRGALEAGC